MKRNFSIKNETKAKRIKWGDPQNQISWAYMKMLREHNDTKKIYDVNPYVEVYQFRENLYGLFTQNCDGAGDVWMYLIVGPERALLIDTAFGLGDLKGLVDVLAGGKEILVANTHGHMDHAYGNCRFGKAYCHEYEVPALKKENTHMFDYLFDENGDNVWLGGHAPGNAGYLDKKNRIFFPGDDLCSDGGAPRERMFKYIKGFGPIAYTEKGIYRPNAEECKD